MPQLFLHGAEVSLLGVELDRVGMPQRMGALAGLIQAKGLEVSLDDLLYGLGCPGTTLADEKVIIRAYTLSPFFLPFQEPFKVPLQCLRDLHGP